MAAALLLLFLALSISDKSPLAQTNGGVSAEPVLDIKGEQVRTDTPYYIVSAIWGAGGGGVSPSSTRNKTCPLDVVQEASDLNSGRPVTFSPAETDADGVVRLSTDLNIKFDVFTQCLQTTVWKVDKYDELTKQWYITTGGVEGNPGSPTLRNWFKIEEGQLYGAYKLRFCPSVCDVCRPKCSDVGRYFSDNARNLVLSDEPFLVVFVKATGYQGRLISKSLSTSM